MSEIMRRSYSFEEYEVRVAGDEKRTVCGICVPYERPERVALTDGRVVYESFQKGSFAKTLQDRTAAKRPIKLYAQHNDRQFPLAKPSVLEERAEGLYGEFPIPRTTIGDDILTLIKDEVIDGFSVSFKPIESRDVWDKQRKSVTRTEVMLKEISLVGEPAFLGAEITDIRQQGFQEEVSASSLSVVRARLIARGIL